MKIIDLKDAPGMNLSVPNGMDSDIPSYLSDYKEVREVPGRGLCGIMGMMFTTGLFYGLDEHGYSGRYCYEKPIDAILALKLWDGQGDPPGRWIKHKAHGVDQWNEALERS